MADAVAAVARAVVSTADPLFVDCYAQAALLQLADLASVLFLLSGGVRMLLVAYLGRSRQDVDRLQRWLLDPLVLLPAAAATLALSFATWSAPDGNAPLPSFDVNPGWCWITPRLVWLRLAALDVHIVLTLAFAVAAVALIRWSEQRRAREEARLRGIALRVARFYIQDPIGEYYQYYILAFILVWTPHLITTSYLMRGQAQPPRPLTTADIVLTASRGLIHAVLFLTLTYLGAERQRQRQRERIESERVVAGQRQYPSHLSKADERMI